MMGRKIFQPQMKILRTTFIQKKKKKISNELLQQVDEEKQR